jgi:glycine cleavage system H protein
MSDIPADLMYTKSHEWLRRAEDGSVIIGITDHAQQALGDMVFIELPEAGMVFEAGGDMAVVESVKAASDVYAPVSGEVLASNEALVDMPELINSDPYGEAWFLRLKPSDAAQLDGLLDADAYAAAIAEED